MKQVAYHQNKLALISFRLLLPVVILILTWLGFNAIFYHYAPYGRFITVPIARLNEPLNLVLPVEVWDETSVTQHFVAEANGLAAMKLQVVTWGDRDRPNNVFWQLSEIDSNGTKALKRNGKFHAIKAKDWEFVDLKFKPIVDSACKHYEISFSAPGTPQSKSIGFPIYKTLKPPLAEEMSRIVSGEFKDTEVYSQGSLNGYGDYFYENFD